MKYKTFFYILSFFVLVLPLKAESPTPQDPQDLLWRIDKARNILDLRCEVTLTSYQNGKIQEHETLEVQVKTSRQENKTLVWFASPASVKGRRMLMAGNTVYLLFPATSNPIRLSPLQVLVGEASNGDVARTGFAQEFQVRQLQKVTYEGQACWLFHLSAKQDRQTGTYAEARLWVSQKNLHPLKAEFLTASGELLKTGVYEDWKAIDGKQFPCRLVITDAQDPSKHTVLTYSRVSSHPVPESLFQRVVLSSWYPGGNW